MTTCRTSTAGLGATPSLGCKTRPMLLQYIYSGPQYQQYWIYWDEVPYEENSDDTGHNDNAV